jgi:hypothetical protein
MEENNEIVTVIEEIITEPEIVEVVEEIIPEPEIVEVVEEIKNNIPKRKSHPKNWKG